MDFINRLTGLVLLSLLIFVLFKFILPVAGAVSGFLSHFFRFLDRVILPL